MILVVSQFVFFAALIVGAGSFLSHYADAIAEITGFGRMLIGSVLLASATSLPELSVDIACIRQGNPDLAVGDLLGSSLMNLLILAVLDLTYRSRGKMFSRAASGHALGGAASIALTAIVAVSLLVERQTGGRELIGLGMGAMAVSLQDLNSPPYAFHASETLHIPLGLNPTKLMA
jgi:cation:H+ antiporter